jgi:lipopolysaccharide assembly outer membrane protein LptD (OstA)
VRRFVKVQSISGMVTNVAQLLVIFLLMGLQQDQVQIVANGDQTRDEKPGSPGFYVSHAEDHVVVTYRDMRVETDKLDYDDETNIAVATGHIVYTRAAEHLNADHVTFNVETKEADFDNVNGELEHGFYIAAEHAHRRPDGIYELKNATVTSCCSGPRPGWMLSTARTVVDPGTRLTANGSVFRLGNIPVFICRTLWFPALIGRGRQAS